MNLEERFWAKVDRSDPDGCWIWTGGRTSDGYGLLFIREDGRSVGHRAHRLAWELTHGEPIPEGLVARHTHCHNPLCVRVGPGHVEVGTQRQNILDSVRDRRLPTQELTWEQVRQIRRMYAAGKSQNQLARMFGVTQANVSYIVSGKTWVEPGMVRRKAA